mmetsp:Transcript_1304/g.2293  ORF Transcript_1304/g.2293 Transcript_1304/m.2293 type:complete len:280 (+) Transcript_1304:52-891(+)
MILFCFIFSFLALTLLIGLPLAVLNCGQFYFFLVQGRPFLVNPLGNLDNTLIPLPNSPHIFDVPVEFRNVQVEILLLGIVEQQKYRLSVFPTYADTLGRNIGFSPRFVSRNMFDKDSHYTNIVFPGILQKPCPSFFRNFGRVQRRILTPPIPDGSGPVFIEFLWTFHREFPIIESVLVTSCPMGAVVAKISLSFTMERKNEYTRKQHVPRRNKNEKRIWDCIQAVQHQLSRHFCSPPLPCSLLLLTPPFQSLKFLLDKLIAWATVHIGEVYVPIAMHVE